MFWIIIMALVVLMALAIMIYMLPSGPAVKAKKKKEKKLSPAPVTAVAEADKDWKSIAERWEKHNQSLQTEIEKMKAQQRKDQQAAQQQKAEVKDLGEKLALEKSWREKEQETLEKFKSHEKSLKDQIFRTEADLEKEHSRRLGLERELQELKIKHEESFEEKRQLSIKASSQQTTLESNAREIRELRADNARLKEKREDIQWVAKSEFDEVKKELEQLKKKQS